MEKKFLLVSLEEEKAKKVAEIISNKTARKILDFLTEHKEASESEMAKALKVPISTVHYNTQNLLKCDLIESKEFKWSEKGKEIDIYRIAKKYIVIAPKSMTGLQDRLRSILPAILVTAAGSLAVYWYTKPQEMLTEALPMAAEKIAEDAPVILAQAAPGITSALNPAIWFLMGAWLAMLIFVLYSWRSRKDGR